MKNLFEHSHKSLMSKKFFSMLLGGTLTMMVVSVLLMSDSVIAGVVLGADAVAGITLVTPVYSLSAFFGSVFSLGVPIVYSMEMGKFNKQGADESFGFGLLMSLSIGVLLFLAVSLFGDAYLCSNTPPEAVLAAARGYLLWMRFTILLLPLQMLMGAAVYSDGDETISTIANIVQGVGNLVASIVLSHIMGIRGISLASFLFNVISMGILLIHFLKKGNSLRWNLYFSRSLLVKVLRYSIIDSSSYLFLAAMTAALNAFVSARFGAEHLILVSVVTLCREFQLIFDGIGEAVTPIFSVYLGEESQTGVKSIYGLAEKTAIVEGIAVTVVLMICAPFAPGVMKIGDPALAQAIVTGVRLVSLGSVFVSLLYLLTSYYLVIEKIALGLAASALRDVVLSVGLAVALGLAFGTNGMFLGLAAAPAVAYALLLLYLSQRYGWKNSPLLLSTMQNRTQSYLFQLSAEPEQIIDAQVRIGALLQEKGLNLRTIRRVELLIEEVFMLVREKNGGKTVLCECAVLLRPEGVQLIMRDDGVLFDISNEDMALTSLNAFIVSSYMEKLGEYRRYLATMGYNRSAFLIRTDR